MSRLGTEVANQLPGATPVLRLSPVGASGGASLGSVEKPAVESRAPEAKDEGRKKQEQKEESTSVDVQKSNVPFLVKSLVPALLLPVVTYFFWPESEDSQKADSCILVNNQLLKDLCLLCLSRQECELVDLIKSLDQHNSLRLARTFSLQPTERSDEALFLQTAFSSSSLAYTATALKSLLDVLVANFHAKEFTHDLSLQEYVEHHILWCGVMPAVTDIQRLCHDQLEAWYDEKPLWWETEFWERRFLEGARALPVTDDYAYFRLALRWHVSQSPEHRLTFEYVPVVLANGSEAVLSSDQPVNAQLLALAAGNYMVTSLWTETAETFRVDIEPDRMTRQVFPETGSWLFAAEGDEDKPFLVALYQGVMLQPLWNRIIPHIMEEERTPTEQDKVEIYEAVSVSSEGVTVTSTLTAGELAQASENLKGTFVITDSFVSMAPVPTSVPAATRKELMARCETILTASKALKSMCRNFAREKNHRAVTVLESLLLENAGMHRFSLVGKEGLLEAGTTKELKAVLRKQAVNPRYMISSVRQLDKFPSGLVRTMIERGVEAYLSNGLEGQVSETEFVKVFAQYCGDMQPEFQTSHCTDWLVNQFKVQRSSQRESKLWYESGLPAFFLASTHPDMMIRSTEFPRNHYLALFVQWQVEAFNRLRLTYIPYYVKDGGSLPISSLLDGRGCGVVKVQVSNALESANYEFRSFVQGQWSSYVTVEGHWLKKGFDLNDDYVYAVFRGEKPVDVFAVHDGKIMKTNWKPKLKIAVVEQRGCPNAASSY